MRANYTFLIKVWCRDCYILFFSGIFLNAVAIFCLKSDIVLRVVLAKGAFDRLFAVNCDFFCESSLFRCV